MALRIDIVTLFVEMFDSFLQASIVGRAIRRGLVDSDCRVLSGFVGLVSGFVGFCRIGTFAQAARR